MKKLLLLFIFAIPTFGQCTGSGATWTCPSGVTPSQIQAAINGTSGTNPTITFAGGGTWTLNASVDLIKATNGVTLICATAPLTQGAATSAPCIFNLSSNFGMSDWPGTNSKFFRISGFQMRRSGSGFAVWIGYSCATYPSPCSGILTQVRIDHNTFDQAAESVGVFVGDNKSYYQVFGVIDHNIQQSTTGLWGAGAGSGAILNWIGGQNPSPMTGQLGSANNLFVETNLITYASSGITDAGEGVMDSWGGAAIVMRYNTIIDGLATAHAVTHAGGPNNIEYYHNSTTQDSGSVSAGVQDCYRSFHHQGADTIMVWGNSCQPFSGHNSSVWEVLSYRDYAFDNGGTPGSGCCSIDSTGFPATDGFQTNPPDGNRAPTTTYYGYPGWHQPGRDTDGTYKPIYAWQNVFADAFAAPDNGGINFVNHFAGTVPPSCTGQPAGTCDYSGAHNVQNRDWFNPAAATAQTSSTSPFNGTSGMGFGTLANRPTTCTTSTETAFGHGAAGVGYYASDVGAQGTLYTCSATNTWTVYYTPYTYPHPLVGGNTPPPPAPNPVSIINTANAQVPASGTQAFTAICNPQPCGTVSWSTTSGTIATNPAGSATATLTAPSTAQNLTVTASAGGKSASFPVTVMPTSTVIAGGGTCQYRESFSVPQTRTITVSGCNGNTCTCR